MMGMAFSVPTATDVPPTGKEIMTRVDDRPDGDDRKSVLTMTLTSEAGSGSGKWRAFLRVSAGIETTARYG